MYKLVYTYYLTIFVFPFLRKKALLTERLALRVKL